MWFSRVAAGPRKIGVAVLVVLTWIYHLKFEVNDGTSGLRCKLELQTLLDEAFFYGLVYSHDRTDKGPQGVAWLVNLTRTEDRTGCTGSVKASTLYTSGRAA
jgi:hypothetical protein